ncbi:MAG: hypothetical protein HY763_13740 [Planctomycetes bacterium]|nr:hypothetical protein [Planctomycetota bacterium]
MHVDSTRVGSIVAGIACLAVASLAVAQQPKDRAAGNDKPAEKAKAEPKPAPAADVKAESEEREESWGIDGPIGLRSADPVPPGELEIKNIFEWNTTADSDKDDGAEYELELEYGLVKNHELLLRLPVELGDGRIDGNADLTFGWHWRLWEEQGWLPAFAMRNFLRVPSGVDSSGVDWEWRPLITKTLVPNSLRVHVNPFLRLVNGNNEEEARHFHWGSLFGLDWKINDSLLFITDYKYTNGELEHTRDNHSAEFGLDWKLAEHHKLGLSTEVSLDGDEYGPAFATKVSYIFSIGG